MPFPYSFTLLDDFNRADNVSLGANWTSVVPAQTDGLQIISNEAERTTSSASYWSAASFGNDNGAYETVDWHTAADGSGIAGFVIRGSSLTTSSSNWYQCIVIKPNVFRIDKIVAGAFTGGLATANQTVSSGDKIGAAAVGNAITMYYNNGGGWTQICTVNDSSIATGGSIGMLAIGGDLGLNDFTGGTATGGSAPVANFTGTPTSGSSPLSVAFTDSSTNTPTSWLWEKNDGTGWVNFSGSPTSQNPTESFS